MPHHRLFVDSHADHGFRLRVPDAEAHDVLAGRHVETAETRGLQLRDRAAVDRDARAVDVLACPRGQGRMKLLALVKSPVRIARQLAAAGEVLGEEDEVGRRGRGADEVT